VSDLNSVPWLLPVGARSGDKNTGGGGWCASDLLTKLWRKENFDKRTRTGIINWINRRPGPGHRLRFQVSSTTRRCRSKEKVIHPEPRETQKDIENRFVTGDLDASFN